MLPCCQSTMKTRRSGPGRASAADGLIDWSWQARTYETSNELAFQISGLIDSQSFALSARSVPEPSSLVLLAGLLTAGLSRRGRSASPMPLSQPAEGCARLEASLSQPTLLAVALA